MKHIVFILAVAAAGIVRAGMAPLDFSGVMILARFEVAPRPFPDAAGQQPRILKMRQRGTELDRRRAAVDEGTGGLRYSLLDRHLTGETSMTRSDSGKAMHGWMTRMSCLPCVARQAHRA